MVRSLISSSTIETRSPDFKGQQSVLLNHLAEEEDYEVEEDKAQPSRLFKSFIDSFVSGKKCLSEAKGPGAMPSKNPFEQTKVLQL